MDDLFGDFLSSDRSFQRRGMMLCATLMFAVLITAHKSVVGVVCFSFLAGILG